MESTLFKISEPSRVSGVLYGPITLVYGLGGIALTLADKYILSKIKCNKVLKIILSFIIIGIGVISVKHNNDSFKLKTITSACEEFGLYGSIAYNKNKSSIYIDNVTYCGEKKLPKYKKISCTLFEKEKDTINVINSYDSEDGKIITIDLFLKDFSFKVDDYEHTCKNYKNDSFYLEIKAITLDDKVELHEIPLILGDGCN